MHCELRVGFGLRGEVRFKEPESGLVVGKEGFTVDGVLEQRGVDRGRYRYEKRACGRSVVSRLATG